MRGSWQGQGISPTCVKDDCLHRYHGDNMYCTMLIVVAMLQELPWAGACTLLGDPGKRVTPSPTLFGCLMCWAQLVWVVLSFQDELEENTLGGLSCQHLVLLRFSDAAIYFSTRTQATSCRGSVCACLLPPFFCLSSFFLFPVWHLVENVSPSAIATSESHPIEPAKSQLDVSCRKQHQWRRMGR